MVSIRQSLSELDAAYRFRTAALESYRAAVQCVGQYAVELDSEATASYRRDMDALSVRIGSAHSEEALTEAGARFRAGLRDYRDRASQFLTQLRHELAEKAASLQQIFQTMAEGDGDHELRIGKTIRKLRELATNPNAALVRSELQDTASSLDDALQEMKRQHQLTVAQFLVEIQMLHQRIGSLEAAAQAETSTGLGKRSEFEARVQDAIEGAIPFSLLLVRIRNLAAIRRQFAGVESPLMVAFTKRLQNCLKPEDVTATWADDRIVVLQTGPKNESLAVVRRVAEHVSGTYVIRVGERLVRPSMQLNVGAVESRQGDTAAKLFARVDAFYEALG